MSPSEYEKIVFEIVEGINEAEPKGALCPQYGSRNRVIGLSGYKHQIDVSLTVGRSLYLLECKRWSGKVGVAEILVLAGRISDIQAAHPNHIVKGLMVSTTRATRGADQLTKHFNIQIELATSAHEYGIRIGTTVLVGAAEQVGFRDYCSAEIIKANRPLEP